MKICAAKKRNNFRIGVQKKIFLGKGQATKSDKFSEKFQTAASPLPPSSSEKYNAIILWQLWLHICEEVWWAIIDGRIV